MKNSSHFQKIFPLLAGALVTLILILLINRDYPYVGHDYRYFIVRLVDTDIHIHLHGLSIQWYSPSFAGGLPAYPNPQHVQYSIVQWLTFLTEPWTAILITTAAASLVGYYFFYRFLRDRLGLGTMASTLGSMFFLGNGFYIEHMIAGHLGFQLFPLSALILYIITDTKNRILWNVLVTTLLIVLMIYHAGFIVSILLIVSFSMALPIVHLYKPASIDAKRILTICTLAMLPAIAICSSKLYAAFSFMQLFPRQISDTYAVSLIQGLAGVVAQLLGLMTLAPVAWLTGTDTDLLSGALYNITGAEYGIWELDTAISPVLLFFLIQALTQSIATVRKAGIPKHVYGQGLPILLLVAAIWINLELTLAKGMIYSLTKLLPILKSLHVNVRFTAAFIVPLVIVGSIQIERFLASRKSAVPSVTLIALTILGMCSYFFLSQDLHSRHLDISPLKEIDRRIEKGDRFPVHQILDIPDLYTFTMSASSYVSYEVLFGYELEEFKPETHPGSILEETDGYFNITNPSSLVFPEENGTYPFERIKVSERDKLEVFVNRGQPDWKIPAVQRSLNVLSVVTLLVCLGATMSLMLVAGRKTEQ